MLSWCTNFKLSEMEKACRLNHQPCVLEHLDFHLRLPHSNTLLNRPGLVYFMCPGTITTQGDMASGQGHKALGSQAYGGTYSAHKHKTFKRYCSPVAHRISYTHLSKECFQIKWRAYCTNVCLILRLAFVSVQNNKGMWNGRPVDQRGIRCHAYHVIELLNILAEGALVSDCMANVLTLQRGACKTHTHTQTFF